MPSIRTELAAELPPDLRAPVATYYRNARMIAMATGTLAERGEANVVTLEGGKKPWVASGWVLVGERGK